MTNILQDNIVTRSICLYTASDIDDALKNVSKQLAKDLPGPLTVIGIMTGAAVTLGHLLTKLTQEVTVDYLHLSRYQDNLKGGEQLHWLAYPGSDLQGATILLVDDIFDEGITLEAAKSYCEAQGAKQVVSCVLVNKLHERKDSRTVDYAALTVPDCYVFGFGMDYQQKYRNLPGIYQLSENN